MPPTRERQATLPLAIISKMGLGGGKIEFETAMLPRPILRLWHPPLAYGHLFLTRWISRRSRFVGRPPVSKVRVDAFFSWNASSSRAWRLSAVSSQSVAAAVPDPLVPETPRSTTVWEKGGRRIVRRSPTATTRDRLARSPPRSTFPPSTASAASDRVLKKRAAHSHLSNLTWTLEESSVLDMALCLSGIPRSASTPSKEGPYGQIHRNRRSCSKLHERCGRQWCPCSVGGQVAALACPCSRLTNRAAMAGPYMKVGSHGQPAHQSSLPSEKWRSGWHLAKNGA